MSASSLASMSITVQSPSATTAASTPAAAVSASASASASASQWTFGAGFDMKEWINAQMDSAANNATATPTNASGGATTTATAASASLSAATAHLSALLMKLQLQTADVHNQMERQSGELVAAMPKAVREIGFIHRESQSLRVSLTDILKDMANMEHAPQQTQTTAPATALPATATAPGAAAASPPPAASAASTIEFLQSIDVVKGRIQRCAHTLEEMEQWQQREALIDSMFSNMQISASGASGDDACSAAATTSLVSASCYADLARIHRELNVMQRIVDRVRTMGLNQEHESRIASLAAYQTRLAHLTELCLDQTLELVQANSVAPSFHLGTDGGPIVLLDTDSSASSDSDDLVGHLQVLHQIYSALGKLASFQSKYATQKIKPAFAKHVVNKYKSATPATVAVPSKASPSAAVVTHSVGQHDVSCLDSWLGAFFSDVVQFTLGELSFAQQVFGVAPPPLASTGSSSSMPDRSKFATASERDNAEAAAAAGAAPSTVEAPSFDFVYSALLESLHSELIPLMSVWFNAFLQSKKSSDSVQLVLQLWELSVQKLGWPLANLFFPPVAAAAAATASHHTHAAPTSPVLPAPLQTAQGETSSLGFRLPHWSESQQLAQQSLLVELLYQPFIRYVEDYSTLEKKKLFASLDGMSFGGEGYEQTAANIADCHRVIVTVSTAARERCILLSGGVLTEPLLASLQEFYTEYIQRMFSLLRRLRRIAGLDGVMSAAAKAGPSVPGSAGSDGANDGGAAAAAAAAADLSSADAQWSNFQGCFQLLRVCRAMQWDLFAPHAEEAVIEQMCGQGLIAVMRSCEEAKERTAAKSAAASTKHASAFAAARRNSFSSGPAPSPQSASSSSSAVSSSPSPSPFKCPSDLSRLLFVSFLLHHPDRLKSLDAFMHRHYLPSHPGMLQSLLTAQQMQEEGHQTQGLHSHPGTPMLAASPAPSSATAAAAAANRAKFGFPTPGSGMLSPMSPASAAPTGASAATHSSHLFPSAAALFDSFISALHNLIYDVMFMRIGVRLANLHEWPVWSSSGQGKDLRLSSIPLPSFSLQPSDYMIQVGEHLLTLVQQLEPFVKGDEDDNQDEANGAGAEGARTAGTPNSPFGHTAAPASAAAGASSSTVATSPPAYLESDALYWLNLLCKGTFKSLLGSFAQLSALSERGAKQLATDCEYLVNVLSALGLQMPTAVIKLTLWLQTNEATLAQKLAAGALSGESEWNVSEMSVDEKRVLRQLIRCRKFTAIEKDKQLQAIINQ